MFKTICSFSRKAVRHLFFAVFMFILSTGSLHADTDLEEADILSFYPELIGFIVLVVSTITIFSLAHKIGVVFKKGLKTIGLGALSFTLALLAVTLGEMMGIEESILIELLFEGFMVLGGILLILGSKYIYSRVTSL